MRSDFKYNGADTPSAMRRRPAKGNRLLACAFLATLVFHARLAVAAVGVPVPAAVNYICPPSVPVSIAQDAVLPSAWTTYIDSDLYLHAVTATGGPPELHADLAAYTSRPGKNEWSFIYDLRDDDEFSQGKWLQCGYGMHSEVTLSQRMPDSVKSCTFTYKKGKKAGQNDIRIECK